MINKSIQYQRMRDNFLFKNIKKHWLSLAFVFGFLTDLMLLNKVDDTIDNLILLFYLILATTSLILFYVGVAERVSEKWVKRYRLFMPLAMQYSFGGLLSGMLIFYGRSGDFLVSAPFFVLIIAVILSNEFSKKESGRLVYNLAVYFVGVFSYFVLVVPVFIGDMGDIIFVGSGLLALVLVSYILKVLKSIIPRFLELKSREIIFTIGSLYFLFNGFYFLNLIPPIPLSLTELNVYQKVERTAVGGYLLVGEEKSWRNKIPFISENFHPLRGEGVSCFARVYAPTKLTTDITHRWEYLDSNGKWREHFRLSYEITGENKNGYRGFTTLSNVRDGKWRCVVENKRGQVLGRKTFTVDTSRQPTDLVTIVE